MTVVRHLVRMMATKRGLRCACVSAGVFTSLRRVGYLIDALASSFLSYVRRERAAGGLRQFEPGVLSEEVVRLSGPCLRYAGGRGGGLSLSAGSFAGMERHSCDRQED